MSNRFFHSLSATIPFPKSRFKLLSNAAVIFIVCLTFTLVVRGQSLQKFVSAENGRDSAPCTLKFPCRTFAAAIRKAPPRGEIIALEAGDYGSVTITRAITISGPAEGFAGISFASGAAVTINAGLSDTVTLRRLALNGPGTNGLAPGILFEAGDALSVENCVIDGFSGPGIAFNSAGQLFVKDTTVRNCRQSGVNMGISIGTRSGKTTAFIDHSRLEKNDFGLVALGNANVTVRDSVAAGNGIGFAVTASGPGSAAEMNIESCVATGNEIGILSTSGFAGGGALVRVSNSTVTNNGTGVIDTEGGMTLTRGNNTVEGNAKDGAFTGKFEAK